MSLFQYLFDKLIAESQRLAADSDCLLYPLEIDERINWLQKALDCLEHSCLSSRAVSEDLKIKKEQTKFSIKVLNLQKMVVRKLAKIDEEDVPRLRHFYTYSLAQQLTELLDITDRYEMLSVQLRALDLLEETQPAQNPEEISSRLRLFQVTWQYYILKIFIKKYFSEALSSEEKSDLLGHVRSKLERISLILSTLPSREIMLGELIK